MQLRHFETRALLPLALALAGALFAAFATMVGANQSASAITNCTVTHDGNDSEELAFLGLINTYRSQNGLGALSISTNLNRGSAWMAQDLADNNYFAHTDSLGRSPYSRGIDCGYPSGAGENLAAGGAWSTAAAAFQAWQTSPGHNSNMLGQYYQQIGIARYFKAGSQYGWYWATTFGATNDGTGGGGAGPTATPTRTNTPVPPTSTNTPVQGQNPSATPTQGLPTSTPTTTGNGGSQPSPTQPLPTSTPTQPSQNGGQLPPTPPLPTSTPTKANTATPAGTSTNTPTPTSTATKTPSATATPPTPGNSLPLSPGANLVAWPSENMAPEKAFEGTNTVSVVYEWDPLANEWKRYFPGLPGYLNNLKTMKQGGAYWVIAKTKSSLNFGP